MLINGVKRFVQIRKGESALNSDELVGKKE